MQKLILIICNWSMSCNSIEYAAEHAKNRKICRAEETRKQICQDFINKTLSRKRYKSPKAPDSKKWKRSENRLRCSTVGSDHLVVRTMHCIRNNPGSNPGLDSSCWKKKLRSLQNLIPETIKQNNIYRRKYKTVSSFRKIVLCKN